MMTPEALERKVAGIEKNYSDFLIREAAQWRTWAEQSNLMAAGKNVRKEDVPEFFQAEYDWVTIVLEMEAQGEFNWSDPRIGKLFAEAAQSPFYQLWGDTITEVSLIVAELAGVKTFLETGAGRANLTSIMLAKLKERKVDIPLVITDAHEAVLENIARLKNEFPSTHQETLMWDINTPPPPALLSRLEAPVLMYERASLTYANFKSIENLARAADLLVLGDYFNYTGELFAYDLIFEKIGLKPLLYKDVQKVFDRFFPNRYVLDQRVNDTIALPNISLVVAWK